MAAYMSFSTAGYCSYNTCGETKENLSVLLLVIEVDITDNIQGLRGLKPPLPQLFHCKKNNK